MDILLQQLRSCFSRCVVLFFFFLGGVGFWFRVLRVKGCESWGLGLGLMAMACRVAHVGGPVGLRF